MFRGHYIILRLNKGIELSIIIIITSADTTQEAQRSVQGWDAEQRLSYIVY